MSAQDLQLVLHGHLSQATLAATPQDLSRHLNAFTRDWKKEPTLEQFDAGLSLLRESRSSPTSEAVALWWMGYLQDICLDTHIDKLSSELSYAMLKAADALAELVKGSPGTLTKRALQVCAATYPTVFLICCQESAAHVNLWNEYAIRIKQLALGHFGGTNEGVTLSLCKYLQTAIQTQSYSQPNSTPQGAETVALNMIAPSHPFLNANVLQQEADRLLQDLLSVIRMPMVSSTVVTAVINQTSALQRARPQLVPLILGTWISFAKPSPPTHFTPLQAKFIDKSIRIQLLAVSKMQLQPPQVQAVTEALSAYGIRFSGGTLSRSQQQQLLHPDKDSDDSKRSGKRSRPSNQDSEDAELKRLKVEPDSAGNTPPAPAAVPAMLPPNIPPGFGQTLLGQINITQLPLHHVVDIIFETLAANHVPHLFHSFLSTLPVMRLSDGPLPMPPPGVGPPPPGLLLQRPPPPLLPGMMPPPPGGMFPPPPPHLLPPHLTALPPQLPMPLHVLDAKQDGRPDTKKEVNLSKLQLPRISDDIRVNITVLPPKHTPTQLPSRPVVVKSNAVTAAHPRKGEPSDKDITMEPKVEDEEAQRLLKQETFQMRPFEASVELPGVQLTTTPTKRLLEQTFERILDSEHVVSVPAASGRKMLESAASSHRHPEQLAQGSSETEGAIVPSEHGDEADQPTKVVTKADWMTIVSRLLTRAFARDSESGGASPVAGSIDRSVKDKMIDFICKDFKTRRELALTWLHEEWYYDGICQRQVRGMDDREPQYLWCLYKILDGISPGATLLDPRDRGLSRFLLEVPELPDGAVDIIQKYCDDPARAQLGISCLRDVVNLRPPSRSRALDILLSYTAHFEKLQRSMAIVTTKKWYLEHPAVGAKVEEYSLAQLETLKNYPVPKRHQIAPSSIPGMLNEDTRIKVEETVQAQPSGEQLDGAIKIEAMDESTNDSIKRDASVDRSGLQSISLGSSSGPAVTIASSDSAEQAFVEAEEDIGRLLELYLSLCAKNHGLLEVLFTHYASYDPFVQRVVRQKIQPLVKSIKSDSSKLLALIRDFPTGSETLVLRIIFILTDGVHPSQGLVSAVQHAVITHDLNARFLIPIIGGLDRGAVFASLPRIVSLLKGTERERRTVTDVFIKLLTGSGGAPSQNPAQALPTGSGRRNSNGSNAPLPTSTQLQSQSQTHLPSTMARGPVMSPSELLIELHALEDTVGWKSACEAMDICFNHPEIYKSEIIAVVLQQLLDQPAIPSLFMRTVIQAITLYKNLVGFVNSMILAKLINRKVWTRPVLWKGFVRCAKMMQPTSSSVLASLPKPQLKEILTMEPSLKESVEAYIKAKSSGRRIGGGAAKQVNVHNVANNDVAPLPPRLPIEDPQDDIKQEQDSEGGFTDLRDSREDGSMGSNHTQNL